jgi:hypothetical protein
MPSLGSWVRFIVGIILAVEVIRAWVFGGPISMLGNLLAVAFLGLAVVYFAVRF